MYTDLSQVQFRNTYKNICCLFATLTVLNTY